MKIVSGSSWLPMRVGGKSSETNVNECKPTDFCANWSSGGGKGRGDRSTELFSQPGDPTKGGRRIPSE